MTNATKANKIVTIIHNHHLEASRKLREAEVEKAGAEGAWVFTKEKYKDDGVNWNTEETECKRSLELKIDSLKKAQESEDMWKELEAYVIEVFLSRIPG